MVAYKLSHNLKIDFVLEILEETASNSTVKLTKRSIIHSDQGPLSKPKVFRES